MAEKTAVTSKAPTKAATGKAQTVARPGEEFYLDAVAQLGQITDAEGLDMPSGIFPNGERKSPLRLIGYDVRGVIRTPFMIRWDKEKQKKTICDCEFLWDGESKTVDDDNIVSDLPTTGTLYLLGVKEEDDWEFYVEGSDGDHYSSADYKCKLYEFDNKRITKDYRLSFMPPATPKDDETTFRLRVVTEEGGDTQKAQVYLNKPDAAVIWNTTPLSPKPEGGITLNQGWNDAGEVGFGSTQYFLKVKVVVKFDKIKKTKTINEVINGQTASVEREVVTHEYKYAEGEYSITKSMGSSTDEPLAKDVDDDSDSDSGTLQSPFIRRVLAADGDSDGTRTPMRATIEYAIHLGYASAEEATNNVLGAIHYLNIMGWEDDEPEGTSGSTGSSSSEGSSASEFPGTSGSGGTSGSSSSSGSSGSSGSGSGSSGSESAGSASGPTGATGTSASFQFVGSVRYQCPYIQQRLDTFDPSTGKVTVGEWVTIEGGTCTPHSAE